ncbi:3-ketoacyl-CoA thiolase [Aphelenchoides avenae]|nr:3-ketoacyl-CoA thiolase [Aphelenchus avenae]
MGIAPVHAIRAICERANVQLDKVDLIETNEAFAAQVLAVQKELGLEKGRLNQDGGAIAIGHPFAASGSRIVGHLAHGLRRTNARYAIGSTCIGGGQGIAVLLEKI